MRIDVLNGFSRVDITPELNGFSRVDLNGFSRVDLQGTYSLNGYVLNGYELNAYQNYCSLNGMNPRSMGSLASFLAAAGRKGIQIGQNVRARREAAGKKPIFQTIRDRRAAAGKKPVFQNIVDRLQQKADEEARGMAPVPTDEEIVITEQMDERGLFSKPELFKNPVEWFQSDRISTGAKVGVVAAGVVLVDALTGGNIILQRVGVMKPKRKK